MKYKNEYLYAIEWRDHCSDDGTWKNNDKEFKQAPITFKTVGWVVEDKPEYVVLAQSGYREKSFRCTSNHMTIIKSCIKKSKRLEIGQYFGKPDLK